jgi:hypothetical protein
VTLSRNSIGVNGVVKSFETVSVDGGSFQSFSDDAIGLIKVIGGRAGITLNVNQLGKDLVVNSNANALFGGSDLVNVGNNNGVGLELVQASVTVENESTQEFGAITLNVNDLPNSLARTATLSTLHRQGDTDLGMIQWTEFDLNGGHLSSHPIFYDSNDVAELNVYLSPETTIVNVQSTVTWTNIFTSTRTVHDTINVGNSTNGLGDIKSFLNLENEPGYNDIILNDVADSASRTATVFLEHGVPGLGETNDYGLMGGLGNIGTIAWDLIDTSSVTIHTNGHSTVSNLGVPSVFVVSGPAGF